MATPSLASARAASLVEDRSVPRLRIAGVGQRPRDLPQTLRPAQVLGRGYRGQVEGFAPRALADPLQPHAVGGGRERLEVGLDAVVVHELVILARRVADHLGGRGHVPAPAASVRAAREQSHTREHGGQTEDAVHDLVSLSVCTSSSSRSSFSPTSRGISEGSHSATSRSSSPLPEKDGKVEPFSRPSEELLGQVAELNGTRPGIPDECLGIAVEILPYREVFRFSIKDAFKDEDVQNLIKHFPECAVRGRTHSRRRQRPLGV